MNLKRQSRSEKQTKIERQHAGALCNTTAAVLLLFLVFLTHFPLLCVSSSPPSSLFLSSLQYNYTAEELYALIDVIGMIKGLGGLMLSSQMIHEPLVRRCIHDDTQVFLQQELARPLRKAHKKNKKVSALLQACLALSHASPLSLSLSPSDVDDCFFTSYDLLMRIHSVLSLPLSRSPPPSPFLVSLSLLSPLFPLLTLSLLLLLWCLLVVCVPRSKIRCCRCVISAVIGSIVSVR